MTLCFGIALEEKVEVATYIFYVFAFRASLKFNPNPYWKEWVVGIVGIVLGDNIEIMLGCITSILDKHQVVVSVSRVQVLELFKACVEI